MNRFELEENITNLYNIVDDLNDISYNIDQELIERDDITDAVNAAATNLKIKLNKLFDVFKQTFFLDEYNGCMMDSPFSCEEQLENQRKFAEMYNNTSCCGKK